MNGEPAASVPVLPAPTGRVLYRQDPDDPTRATLGCGDPRKCWAPLDDDAAADRFARNIRIGQVVTVIPWVLFVVLGMLMMPPDDPTLEFVGALVGFTIGAGWYLFWKAGADSYCGLLAQYRAARAQMLTGCVHCGTGGDPDGSRQEADGEPDG